MPNLIGSRVLSVQSHVVHGVVGNKAAVFPLQTLGFDVDAINTVQLSNHTGYSNFRGKGISADDLQAIIDGLRSNAFFALYSHVLTGYVSTPAALDIIATLVAEVRAAAAPRTLTYVCDPVLGDDGRLYVPAELVPRYRDVMLPLATILTPNCFEAEQLSNTTIVDYASAFAACDILHAAGPPVVVITSSDLPIPSCSIVNSGVQYLTLLASCQWEWVEGDVAKVAAREACVPSGTTDEPARSDSAPSATLSAHARFVIRVPKLPASFTGTGDLTAALLLAHSHSHPGRFVTAVERALATVRAACMETFRFSAACAAALDNETPSESGSDGLETRALAALVRAGGNKLGSATVPAFNELRVVQCKETIERPVVPDFLLAAPFDASSWSLALHLRSAARHTKA